MDKSTLIAAAVSAGIALALGSVVTWAEGRVPPGIEPAVAMEVQELERAETELVERRARIKEVLEVDRGGLETLASAERWIGQLDDDLTALAALRLEHEQDLEPLLDAGGRGAERRLRSWLARSKRARVRALERTRGLPGRAEILANVLQQARASRESEAAPGEPSSPAGGG